MLRAFFVTLITFAYILLLGTPFLIYTIISGSTDAVYRVGILGVKLALWLAGVRMEVRGFENVKLDRPVVFMSNHQSNCDPPAIFAILPPIWVMAKKEFFRVPVLGRAMTLRGFIAVDRKNRPRAIEAIEEGVKSLKAGRSFLTFPEGTRSRDGRLQPFKKGVFIMAIEAEVPIVPISISGSRKVMTKGKFAIHPGPVRITIHAPVPTEGCTADNDRARIQDSVRGAILAGLTREEWPFEAGRSDKRQVSNVLPG